MKYFVLTLFISIVSQFFISGAFSQPGIEWQRSLGGQDAVSIIQIRSGGYVIAGNFWGGYPPDSTSCNPADSGTAWVAKLDGNGSTIWQHCYAGQGQNGVRSIVQTTDGGFVFCGLTDAYVGEGSVFHGSVDAWVVKLDSNGNVLWQYTYGGSKYDVANSIIQTSDGKYVFGGWTYSVDGDVSGNHGADDEWVVKFNTTGRIEWQKCLGGSSYDYGGYLLQAADGGLVITGATTSDDGNVKGNNGSQDMWIVKLRADTSIAWQTCAGGAGDDGGAAICILKDGSYLSAGGSQSYFLNDNYHGGSDYYAVKLNDSGKILSQSCFGGSQGDGGTSVAPTSEGGYLMAGTTNSADGDLVGRIFSNFQDSWVVKSDAAGNLEWERPLGGRWDEIAFSILQSFDGGYVFAGETSSSDGDVTSNYYGGSAWNSWIVKLSDNASVTSSVGSSDPGLKIVPNPASSSDLKFFYTSDSEVRAEVAVYDLLGHCVLRTTDPNISKGDRLLYFDISKIREGTYIVRLSCGNRNITGRFTVIRRE